MFSLNESNRYYLYPYPTDMRKSFYTLSGIVTNQMGRMYGTVTLSFLSMRTVPV